MNGTLLEWALYYASRGWHVLPVYEIGPDARCTCGDPQCSEKHSEGKHPRTSGPGWSASADPEVIRGWWTQWPNANIAVNCGLSNLVVIDLDYVDAERHGSDSLVEFLHSNEIPFNPTPLRANTGGGGNHAFYAMSEPRTGSRNGWLQGVDVKADGGYVLLPPSNHLSGLTYEWVSLNGQLPTPGLLTPELVKALPKPGGGGSVRDPSKTDPAIDGPPIPAGSRNEEMFKIACNLRARNLARSAILGQLYDINQIRCQPPLDMSELEQITDSAMKYEPGMSTGINWPPKNPEEPTGPEGTAGLRNLTDVGNGFRMVDKYGDVLRYCAAMKIWFVWDGIRWREDDLNQVQWMATQTALDIYQEAANAKHRGEDELYTALTKWAHQSENNTRLDAMVTRAGTDPRVTVTPEQFDSDLLLFNTPSGTLDLRSYTIKPHDPNDLITTVCPTKYNPEARDPIFEKALLEAIPDPDMRRFVQRFFGTCLTGETGEKAILVPHGQSNTGKSTITEAVLHTLGFVSTGGYASTWESDVIQDNGRTNKAEKLHKVRAARLVVAAELRKGSKMNDELLKAISGGDTMDARALYKGSFSYRPGFKLVLPTNYVPRSSDPALQTRLRMIPFNNVPQTIDRFIKKHLEESPEAHEAVLAYMVEGWRQYREELSLGTTPWMAQEMANYARDSDPVLDFTESILVSWPDHMVGVHVDLTWMIWEAWAEQFLHRTQRMRRRAFEHAMMERGFVKGRVPAKGGVMCWRGLVLRAFDELPTPCRTAVNTWKMSHPEPPFAYSSESAT